MTEASHNVDQLRQLADYFKSTNLDESVGQKATEADIGFFNWPVLSAVSGLFYYQLRVATEESGKALDEVVKALGKSVETIADDYEKQQQQYAEDLEKINDALERVNSGQDAVGQRIASPENAKDRPGGTW